MLIISVLQGLFASGFSFFLFLNRMYCDCFEKKVSFFEKTFW